MLIQPKQQLLGSPTAVLKTILTIASPTCAYPVQLLYEIMNNISMSARIPKGISRQRVPNSTCSKGDIILNHGDNNDDNEDQDDNRKNKNREGLKRPSTPSGAEELVLLNLSIWL